MVLFKPADPVRVPTSNPQLTIADCKVIQVSLVAVLAIRQRSKPVVDSVAVAGGVICVATQHLEPLVKVKRGQVKVHTKAGPPSASDVAVNVSYVRPVGACRHQPPPHFTTIVQNDDVVVSLSRRLVAGVPTAELELVTHHRGTIQIGIVPLVYRKRRKPIINVIAIAIRTAAIPTDQADTGHLGKLICQVEFG